MSEDIVDRLESKAYGHHRALRNEAAEEIRRLRKENAELLAFKELCEGQEPAAWRTELEKLREVIANAPIDCLGSGYADGCAPWPIRDEVVDGITKLLAAYWQTEGYWKRTITVSIR